MVVGMAYVHSLQYLTDISHMLVLMLEAFWSRQYCFTSYRKPLILVRKKRQSFPGKTISTEKYALEYGEAEIGNPRRRVKAGDENCCCLRWFDCYWWVTLSAAINYWPARSNIKRIVQSDLLLPESWWKPEVKRTEVLKNSGIFLCF